MEFCLAVLSTIGLIHGSVFIKTCLLIAYDTNIYAIIGNNSISFHSALNRKG